MTDSTLELPQSSPRCASSRNRTTRTSTATYSAAGSCRRSTSPARSPRASANGRVATVAVNSFVFKQPVFVGDLLSFYATITRTGNTSITVDVEVYAQHAPDG